MDPAQLEAELVHARALLRSPTPGDGLAWPEAPEPARRLGWALKAACYETWNTEPALAERAAALLDAFATRLPEPVLRTLAHWTRGIAALAAGRMVDALVHLDQASAGFQSLDDPAHAAQAQVPKLMALSVLGRHEEALQCAEATLAQFVRSGDERSAGKIELNLGTLLFRQDRHAQACQHYRSAALRFARVQDVEHSIMADIGLANALTWQFDFDEALRINERARMRADTRGLDMLSAQARGAIGQLELNRGQAQRALPALAQACRLLERGGGMPQHLSEAELTLADAYLAVNLLPEALALYERVIARCVQHDIPADHARALLHRGQTWARLGRSDAADEDFRAAGEGFTVQDNLASAMLVRLHRSALRLQQGQSQEALEDALHASSVFAEMAIPGWHCEAELLAAEACAALERSTEARRRYEQALQLPGAASHTRWRCQVGLAALARAAGEARQARDWLEQGLAVIEAQQASLPGDEFRTAFGTDKAAAYDELVDLALEAHLASGQGPVTGEALWQAMERARARALTLGLAQGADGPQAVAQDEADTELRTRLTWSREQASQALADGDAAAVAAFNEQALRLEQALLESYRRRQMIGGAAPSPEAEAEAAGPSLQALQARLEVDEAWVQYHLLGNAHAQRWVAVVVRREGVAWVTGSSAGLDERLESLRFQLDAVRGSPAALEPHAAQLMQRAQRHLQALHRSCWQALEPAVAGAQRIHLAPHRSLHYLPFAALHNGSQWLVELHEFCLVPSARLWCQARERPVGAARRLLALGVGGSWLPQVRREVEAVAARFPGTATVLLDDAATAAALRQHAAEADLLHLACHAEFRADSPYFSALHLADGQLSLHDAASLPLRASLVTLSACETGLSRVAPGDEVVGLVRGFLLAGAQRVLASLWTVDDADTAALMDDFYARLAAGAGPATALRLAQALRATEGHHPFFWAAFALHGPG